jgi:transcriptional regulator with XRE-family HTH domain
MNERLKKLRKALELTQQEFADRIGISRGNIGAYEVGKNNPSDAVISLICKEFKVNEEWLRNGTGEMFNESSTSNSILDALANEYNLSPDVYTIIGKFMTLKPEQQQVILESIKKIAAAFGNTANEESGIMGTDIGTVSAEAAYEKTLNSAQNTDSSASSTIEDTERNTG